MFMWRRYVVVVALAVGAVLAGGEAASAASPSDASSCAAQLNQGGTPNGVSQAPGGFLGQFTAAEATSAPGMVGTGASNAAQQHGDLSACLPPGVG